ncbi:helix-turn-helix transcriptional regulator [Rhizobium leguminosarum]|uniref:helix-turn-helix transcriptional regulator n=1 Tax=Rhizobium leguminosarum TaxID=384 RepID=UPI001611A660|nr:helix-turn-helix domain-containing protein [Rhizobium leguminosarum]MBB4339518.1 putative DNA-binding transcriptional regulator AlpA [Rhizobium leguminosarum]MBB6291771.1 putative DNA-binding transcriptional regulator AlpA [Rhizobium leguminosarum]
MLLDTAETATRIGKSQSWLNHARQTGDGPRYLKVGHAVRYRVEDVDRWLASKTRIRVWNFDEKDGEGIAAK